MRRILRWMLSGILVGAVTVAALWILLPPSHDRDWQSLYAVLPDVEGVPPGVTVTGVRDWSYGSDRTVSEERWIDETIDPASLARVWFVVEPFGNHDAIAHTMLSFEFEDGRALVASVEARREVGEEYEAVKGGIVPSYEYIVVWATERDMYADTVFRADGELYAYPLDLPPDVEQAVLSAMLRLTMDVAEEPRWYNTFFANCTNVLVRAVNREREGAVPFDKAWFLPGYAADYLYDAGLIDGDGSFPEAEAAARLTERVPALYFETAPSDFPAALRATGGGPLAEH